MWSKERIQEDLRDLRIREGDALIVHASLRAVGKVEGGADTVIDALLEVVGPEGTILTPTFNYARLDPAGWAEPPQDPHELERLRAEAPVSDEVSVEPVGILAERLRLRPDAHRSRHPLLSFAAVGRNAAFLTDSAPFHYPLGTNSPLARLHQLNGGILLLGVSHAANSALHLAEIWADAPYARRATRVKTGAETWEEMEGSPECSAGFTKIEPVLRQARLLREGYVGNAPSQFMRIQQVVSMALAMLRGDPEALLCENPYCRWCAHARRFTAPSDSSGIGRGPLS